MRIIFILMTVLIAVWPTILFSSAKDLNTVSSSQIESGINDDEYDSESARKIIGSR